MKVKYRNGDAPGIGKFIITGIDDPVDGQWWMALFNSNHVYATDDPDNPLVESLYYIPVAGVVTGDDSVEVEFGPVVVDKLDPRLNYQVSFKRPDGRETKRSGVKIENVARSTDKGLAQKDDAPKKGKMPPVYDASPKFSIGKPEESGQESEPAQPEPMEEKIISDAKDLEDGEEEELVAGATEEVDESEAEEYEDSEDDEEYEEDEDSESADDEDSEEYEDAESAEEDDEEEYEDDDSEEELDVDYDDDLSEADGDEESDEDDDELRMPPAAGNKKKLWLVLGIVGALILIGVFLWWVMQAGKSGEANLGIGEQVDRFMAKTDKTPQLAMDLAKKLNPQTSQEKDALYRLYYYAEGAGNAEAELKYGEILDPATPAWGSIEKDAVLAWQAFKKASEANVAGAAAALQNLEKWLNDEAAKGNDQAKKWLEQINQQK